MLEQVGVHHRLVLITKGELVHQTAKVDVSGLAHHFEQIEIVMEKDAGTYARIIRSLGVPTPRFCMVGNSVRSDTLPRSHVRGTRVVDRTPRMAHGVHHCSRRVTLPPDTVTR